MPLTEANFQRHLGSLRPAFPSQEQRQSNRVPVQSTATVVLIGGQNRGKHQVVMRDISVGGVGIISRFALSPGERFVLLLERDGQTPAGVACEVRHCRKVATGVYSVGARFVSDLVERDGDVPEENAEVERVRRALLDHRSSARGPSLVF
jgi:hypothetical protein